MHDVYGIGSSSNPKPSVVTNRNTISYTHQFPHHCVVLSTCFSLKHMSSVRYCVQSWQQCLVFLRCSPKDDHFRLEPLQ